MKANRLNRREEYEVARPCTVCSSPKAHQINVDLLSLRPVADVSREYRIADSSLRRHARAHLTATVLQEARASETVGAVDLVERLVEALDDVSAVRRQALVAGQGAVLLRAAGVTQTLVASLIDRLGIEATDVARLLRDGEQLASALGAATRANPDVGLAVVERLREQKDHETADALEDAVNYFRQLALTKKESLDD